ncbi:MAG: ABC transporter substrate-binding protein [Oligoflexia bacterium]|nr:ABC transporter substrate-binding protein [Oligoflexia bacterium]MBF0367080.1 ABC transporter substrate-binding protein [Oligoflexia bacterium]
MKKFSALSLSLVFVLILIFVAAGCSQVSTVSKKEKETVREAASSSSSSALYSEQFLKKIQEIKSIYESGKQALALKRLMAIKDAKLLPTEKAMRLNLRGVIFFSEGRMVEARESFVEAAPLAIEDDSLSSQVYINLASTAYKQRQIAEFQHALSQVKMEILKEVELTKVYRLKFLLLEEQHGSSGALTEKMQLLIDYLKKYRDMGALKSDGLFSTLMEVFNRAEDQERMTALNYFINRNSNEDAAAAAILAYLGVPTAERLIYRGQKEEARDLLAHLSGRFQESKEIMSYINEYENRLEKLSQISPLNVGVVFPFSGEKARFAEQAMAGIDSAFQEFITKTPGGGGALQATKFHVRDSQGSGAIGGGMIDELVSKYQVSAVIGGLFPEEATQEYLMAKRFGVFFISLSPVYLPTAEKDFLLLEVPGSVESQVSTLLSKEVLDKFGRRLALFYSGDERGENYVDAIWNLSQDKDKGVVITSAQAYEKNQNDYRGPIKKILGLDFERERQEEVDIFSGIVSLTSKMGQLRTQSLPPVIDFDWIFTTAYPDEAQRVIPTFKYFDTPRVRFCGGPSWRSQGLAKFSDRQTLYFVGDDYRDEERGFVAYFNSRYGRDPKLIEIMSYNSLRVLLKVLGSGNFSARAEFHDYLHRLGRVEAIGGDWSLIDNHWKKELTLLRLKQGKIENALLESNTTAVGGPI